MAKKLYIVDVTDDQGPDIYFTRMTPREATQMRAILSRNGFPGAVKSIVDSPGFHSFEGLMDNWVDRFKR